MIVRAVLVKFARDDSVFIDFIKINLYMLYTTPASPIPSRPLSVSCIPFLFALSPLTPFPSHPKFPLLQNKTICNVMWKLYYFSLSLSLACPPSLSPFFLSLSFCAYSHHSNIPNPSAFTHFFMNFISSPCTSSLVWITICQSGNKSVERIFLLSVTCFFLSNSPPSYLQFL